MSWIIDKDFTDEFDDKTFTPVTIEGPGGFVPTDDDVRFRLQDDDGNIYYEGWANEPCFDPLDDYGLPNDGCVAIEYLTSCGWEIL